RHRITLYRRHRQSSYRSSSRRNYNGRSPPRTYKGRNASLLGPVVPLETKLMRLPDEKDFLDSEFPLGDGTAETTASVYCPYCNETVEIAIDPGGGPSQEYVE